MTFENGILHKCLFLWFTLFENKLKPREEPFNNFRELGNFKENKKLKIRPFVKKNLKSNILDNYLMSKLSLERLQKHFQKIKNYIMGF